MLWALLAVALSGSADPLATAETRFHQLSGYQVTLRSENAHGVRQVLRYAWRAPGLVRMEFVSPHRGALLLYRPDHDKVLLWPFGRHSFPMLALGPDNPLIRDPQGHRVDHSDVGALLEHARQLAAVGSVRRLDDEQVGDWRCRQYDISAAPGETVRGVHRFRLWLAERNLFPVKVVSYGARDQLLETVLMEDVQIDPAFPEHYFDP